MSRRRRRSGAGLVFLGSCQWTGSQVRAALQDRPTVRTDEFAITPCKALRPADLTRILAGLGTCDPPGFRGAGAIRRALIVLHAPNICLGCPWRPFVSKPRWGACGRALGDCGCGSGAWIAAAEQQAASCRQQPGSPCSWRTLPYLLAAQQTQPFRAIRPSTVRGVRYPPRLIPTPGSLSRSTRTKSRCPWRHYASCGIDRCAVHRVPYRML